MGFVEKTHFAFGILGHFDAIFANLEVSFFGCKVSFFWRRNGMEEWDGGMIEK